MTTNSKQIKININNKVLTSNKWGLFTQMDNLPRLGKVLAVPLGFIVGSATDGATNMSEAIPSALFMLFQELESNNQRDLFETIFHDVHADNGSRRVDLEKDFDDLDQLFEAGAKVLEQQYGSLITGKGAKGLFGLLVPMHQMASQ
jgi:hypothetical protein